MNKDITTGYTKEQNKLNGRKGYGMWKREKIISISPKKYGMYLAERKGK